MTDRITIPADQPDASYGEIGGRFYGIYRLPHGKWRELVDKHKERIFFATSQEATRAAMAKMNSLLFSRIHAQAQEAPAVGGKLAADAATFLAGKKSRLVRRGASKRPFTVETKRGR